MAAARIIFSDVLQNVTSPYVVQNSDITTTTVCFAVSRDPEPSLITVNQGVNNSVTLTSSKSPFSALLFGIN